MILNILFVGQKERKMFKLKQKPVEPLRKNFRIEIRTVHETSINWLGRTFDEIIKELEALKVKFPNGKVEVSLDYAHCYYEGDTPEIRLSISEEIFPEQLYQEAYEKYEEQLEKYEKWFEQNEAKIKAEIERRKKFDEELSKLKEKLK